MSSIRMCEQSRTAWWVECSRPGCDYESKPTLNFDKAEAQRIAHYAHHEAEDKEAEAVRELAHLLRKHTPGMAPTLGGDYRLAVCMGYAQAAYDAGWRKS